MVLLAEQPTAFRPHRQSYLPRAYYVGEKLVGIGYVDALPEGLSAIYFY